MYVNATVDEATRIERLRAAAILDTPPEIAFERLVLTAAHLFRTPIALLSFIDVDRQWFKAGVGLGLQETPRIDSFCSHTIREQSPLIISDARLDHRFYANRLVTGPPFIRFYAGTAIVDEQGVPLGALCVIDRRARLMDDLQRLSLGQLARETQELLRTRARQLAADREAALN